MPSKPQQWFDKYKARTRRRDAAPARTYDESRRGLGIGQATPSDGGPSVLSTSASYEYLLGSLRINAPGYSQQNFYEMSRNYVSAIYLAIHNFGIQASQAEVTIYEMDDDPDTRIPLSRYESLSRLIDNPNPEESFREILEQVSLQYKISGTALLWIPHEKDNKPEEMYVLSTASVLPQPVSPQYPNGAYLVQPWYPAGPYAQIPVSQGVGSIIPAEEVIRIKEPHPFFRWIGYATLQAISLQVDVMREIDVSRNNAIVQGVDPSGVISFDPAVKQPDDADLRRLEAQIQSVWAGPKNRGKLIVAPAGGTFSPWGATADTLGYQEGWMQLADFTLAALGVNKAVAGMTGDINYATLFASLEAFYLMSLNPFLAKVAEKITQRLIRPHFSPHFGMDLVGKSIKDKQQIDQTAKTWIQSKAVTYKEFRKLYDLPPSDRDDQWLGDPPPGQEQGAPGMPGMPEQAPGQQETGEKQDPAVEANRPENPESEGGMGPRKTLLTRMADLTKKRNDRLLEVLEKRMTSGQAEPWRGNGRH